jgi:hypothetical protein
MGFVLKADEVPADFRGSSMPSLPRRIAENQFVDANIIGTAVVDLKRNPASWSDRGTPEEIL